MFTYGATDDLYQKLNCMFFKIEIIFFFILSIRLSTVAQSNAF